MKELASLKSSTALRQRIERMQGALDLLEVGLKGNPDSLWKADGQSIVNLLGSIGIELISKTQIKKRGHELKRAAGPVLRCYYGAPIKKHIDLYIFGVQTKPVPSRGTK